MSMGRLKVIENKDAKFGADPWYWFIKVQADGRGEGGEEYWLVTEEEAFRFSERAEKNPEDHPDLRRGVFTRVANTKRKFGANTEYVAIEVKAKDRPVTWFLTEHDLEQIRQRTEANTEDIEANKEGWLADLFD